MTPKPARRAAVFLLAGAAYAATALLPWHADAAIRKASALVVAALVLWISEIAPLGIVGLCIPVLATLSGLLTWPEAIAAWGSDSVFLFLGAFLLARSLEKHGAFDWVARLRSPSLGSTAIVSLTVLCAAGLVSTVQNNTAVAAMMLPAVIALSRRTSDHAVPLLALSLGATFGGMATPVGTAPNFLGYAEIRKVDPSFHFLMWMQVGVPVWIGATLIGWAVLVLASRLRGMGGAGRLTVSTSRDDEPRGADHRSVGDPESTGSEPGRPLGVDRAARIWSVAIFAAAGACWLTIGGIMSATGASHPLHSWLARNRIESLIPIAAACLLFFVRPRGGPAVLERRDLSLLDWDTLFLIAGGMALGKVLESSGAGRALAESLAGTSLPSILTMLMLGAATVLLSELTSNTVTAALLAPLAAQIAPSLGLPPVSAIMLVALCASLGFALPISTPPNAIVYGTRLIPLRRMIGVGVAVDLLCVIWVVICVRWLA